jgi:[protein-PII] uridylyltransferase
MEARAETFPTAWIVERVKHARLEVEARLRAGEGGVALAESLTAAFEAVVVEHIVACLRSEFPGGKMPVGLAVLATGGFSRREFAPYSDLDLVFLCAGEPDERVERLAHAVLHPLWDARLDAGHVVRSLDEALELPDGDLTAATAMLEARFLAGDAALADSFVRRYRERVGGRGPQGLIRRLRDEQENRHSKFGDTIFLLEPDIKSGPGGLRDMCVGRWAATARFGTGDVWTLHDRGEMSRRQATLFEEARAWFLRVRIACHSYAGRKQDQLRFDIQEQIARILYPDAIGRAGEAGVAVAPAVEALMRDYQLRARTFSRETERLLQRAAFDPDRDPTAIPVALESGGGEVDPNLVIRDGFLEVFDPRLFDRAPSEMVRVFAASVELGIPVGLRTKDVVAEICAERPTSLQADSVAAKWFVQVLTDPRDRSRPSVLEQMQDLGVLAALMPEWGPVTGRVQYDMYHHYTVDQHSLYAVAMLKDLARGDVVDLHPRSTQEMALVGNRVPLFVATFLHDIGKPGKNHSARGAPLAARIAARLGLGADDVDEVEFLVRQHLTLNQVSQRRDLDDPGLIERVARLCGGETRLRELYLLTFCDLACIRPGNLTSWKEDLLRSLFHKTQTYLRHGPAQLRAEEQARVRERREQAALVLEDFMSRARAEALFDALPERYFTENISSRIVSHFRLIDGRTGACAVAFNHNPRKEFSEMVLVADDVPGLLATVAGVLYANRIDILDAAIYSARPLRPGTPGLALDLFRIRKAFQGAVMDESRLDSIRKDLESTLEGRQSVQSLVLSRASGGSLLDRTRPAVPATEISLHNDVSPDFTVIDVFTEDRPGVLYTIADVLHRQNLDIQRSKVGHDRDRAADIFYVIDRATGGKVLDPDRTRQIHDALTKALPGRRAS